MRELKIESFCDLCYLEEEARTEATHTWTIGLADSESRPALYILETCDDHAEQFQALKMVIPQLAAYQEAKTKAAVQAPLFADSRPTSGKGSRGPRLRDDDGNIVPRAPTEACQMCEREMTRGGLIMHIWKEHVGKARPAPPTSCPDCDYTGNVNAIGVHRVAEHGYNAVEDAYSHVRGYKAKYRGVKAVAAV